MPPTTMFPLARCLSAHFDVTLGVMPGYSVCKNDLDQIHEANGIEVACPTSVSDDPRSGAVGDRLVQLANTLSDQAPDGAHWVGWSLGATVAMAHAASPSSNPARALTLISPTPCFTTREGWTAGFNEQNFKRLHRLIAKRYQAGSKSFLKLQNGNLSTEQSDAILKSMVANQPLESALVAGKEILCQTDFRPRFSRIDVPTLVLAANDDNVIPQPASQFVAASIPNAVFRTIGSGHAIPLSHSSDICAAVANFETELTQ